jgi:hypothetical protein
MMYYIVHLLNDQLVDNFYFKRNCNEYHPYILRLYFGIIFIIQSLRAMKEVGTLDSHQDEFLTRFLQTHGLESLTIPGPLLPLFKTITASSAEYQNYGKISPLIPVKLGPNPRSNMAIFDPIHFGLPNIPGIFALIAHLDSVMNGTAPIQPAKRWVPIDGTTAVTFNGHAYAHPPSGWSDNEAWSLVSPGLEFPCEASKELNIVFAERYSDYEFPPVTGTDDLSSLSDYLSMTASSSWFNRVKEVAAMASLYCLGSGTLADCAPHSISSNHVIVNRIAPATLPSRPVRMADPASRSPFSYRLRTSDRQLPELSEIMAAAAQINILMYSTHPHLNGMTDAALRTGPYWDIRPQDLSSIDDESYLALQGVIKRLIKSRV